MTTVLRAPRELAIVERVNEAEARRHEAEARARAAEDELSRLKAELERRES